MSDESSLDKEDVQSYMMSDRSDDKGGKPMAGFVREEERA